MQKELKYEQSLWHQSFVTSIAKVSQSNIPDYTHSLTLCLVPYISRFPEIPEKWYPCNVRAAWLTSPTLCDDETQILRLYRVVQHLFVYDAMRDELGLANMFIHDQATSSRRKWTLHFLLEEML